MASFLDLITGLGSEATRLTYVGAFAIFLVATVVIVAMGWRSRLMMTRVRRNTLLALRIAILLLLAGALAQLVATRYDNALSVTFLVDTSQSIPNEQIEKARRTLTSAQNIKGDVPVRMLHFDRVVNEVAGAADIRRLSVKPGTDIARALHTAQGTFGQGTFKRAVLLSDGNQTRGDALYEAGNALARDIQIDVIELTTLTDRDIYIESINLPRQARPGERIDVSITVVANFATEATLKLLRGKATEIIKKVQVQPGSQSFQFSTTVKSNVSTGYTAAIEAETDDHPDNNALSATLRVVGNPRIMVYSGGESQDLSLLDALSQSRLSVAAAPLDQFPTSAARLAAFDLVMLSNIDFLAFGKERTAVLETFVGEYGGGLVVIGGEKGSLLREKKDSDRKKRKNLPIENVLPVLLREKKKTEPNPVALLLLIDKSFSMARENKFGMAMRAAKDSISLLGERSKIGVILFDDFPRWAIPMQVAKDKEKIIQELDRFGVGVGTSIYTA